MVNAMPWWPKTSLRTLIRTDVGCSDSAVHDKELGVLWRRVGVEIAAEGKTAISPCLK